MDMDRSVVISKIERFSGYDLDDLTKHINQWALNFNKEITNLSVIKVDGVEGIPTHYEALVIHKELKLY